MSLLPAQQGAQTIEFGAVHWSRDYAKAQQQAIDKNLPLLILFQEVPG